MSMKIRSLIFVISWLFAFNAFSQCPFTPTFTYNYTFQQCSEIVFTDSSVPSAGYVILTWDWYFDDGSPNGTNPNETHTYTPGSTVNVTLTVTASNDGGLTTCTSSSAPQTINVNPLPDVFISSTPNPGCEGEPVFFTGTSSAFIQSWNWDFGDGASSILKDPSHIYTTSGIYTVTLTVTDVNGCLNSTTYTQHIGQIPVVDF